MSCNFDAKKCVSCPRYNGCLLQLVYANTLGLAELINDISVKQQEMLTEINEIKSKSSTMNEDSVDLSFNMEDLSNKINQISKLADKNEEDKNELGIDISQIKSTISLMDLKIDDLIKFNESFEYVFPEKDEK